MKPSNTLIFNERAIKRHPYLIEAIQSVIEELSRAPEDLDPEHWAALIDQHAEYMDVYAKGTRDLDGRARLKHTANYLRTTVQISATALAAQMNLIEGIGKE